MHTGPSQCMIFRKAFASLKIFQIFSNYIRDCSNCFSTIQRKTQTIDGAAVGDKERFVVGDEAGDGERCAGDEGCDMSSPVAPPFERCRATFGGER